MQYRDAAINEARRLEVDNALDIVQDFARRYWQSDGQVLKKPELLLHGGIRLTHEWDTGSHSWCELPKNYARME